MTSEEQRRARVLAHLTRGDLTIEEAAELLDVSIRHAWRLRAGFLAEGPAALVHGNRGRPSPRRIDEVTRAKVVELAGSDAYEGANDTFLAELLAEHEGIELSRPSLGRILRAAGRASPRQRRTPRHRGRRARMPRAGMLVQVDGSRHDWLEAAGPGSPSWAASTTPPARSWPPPSVTRRTAPATCSCSTTPSSVTACPRPSTVTPRQPRTTGHTSDATGAHHRRWARPTHVGRALAELGIGSIPAAAPRPRAASSAAGHGPGRLPLLLRVPGPTTASRPTRCCGLAAALHAAFSVAAADPLLAWRPLPGGLDLAAICAFRYERVIANDATVRVGGLVLDVPRQRGGRSLAGKRVEVRLELDGRIVVADGTRALLVTEGPLDPGRLRDLESGRLRLPQAGSGTRRGRPGYPPGADHPWARPGRGVQRATDRQAERD